MYIWLNDECNMQCEHCLHDAKKVDKGVKMSRETFLNVEKLIHNTENSYISLGGGEPTLHPDFIPFVERLIEKDVHVWFATNGTRPGTLKKIIKMISQLEDEDFLRFEVSLDYYHDKDMLKDWVIAYAENNKIVRNTTKHRLPDRRGRAITSGIACQERSMCYCGASVLPNGNVTVCGCENPMIMGNVNNPVDLQWLTCYYNEINGMFCSHATPEKGNSFQDFIERILDGEISDETHAVQMLKMRYCKTDDGKIREQLSLVG